MPSKCYMDLLLIFILNALLALVILFIPIDAIRILLGLPLILFSPGYTLIAALFPRKAVLSGIERLALSFGLSVAVVPLISLILNYTPWGLQLYPSLFSIYFFTIIMSIIAYFRRRSLLEENCYYVDFKLPGRKFASQETTIGTENVPIVSKTIWLDRLLHVLLVMVILVVVGTLVFIIASPNTGEKHTEFYILGPDGMVANYPRDITLGQASPVIAGITNREGQQNIYILDMLIEKTKLYSSGPVNLQNNEKWEQEIPIKPLTKAENQKVEFYLYKGTSAEPSLKLHIFVNVK